MEETSPDTAIPTLARPEGDDAPAPARGMAIGRFLVLGSLGMGAMGMVLAAYDPKLERKVALKLLRSDSGLASAEGREQLAREAQAMARLSHPNVVTVYEAVFDATIGYLVMELVEGSTLRTWMTSEARPLGATLDMMIAAGAGLAAAHHAGLVHHDFKPENVLVDGEGRPRVSDFGLAGAGSPGAGTKAYMAPEQLDGAATVDARADQYAFCVTLWEALHGERPEPGARSRTIPRWLERTLARGLSPDPDDRWPSLEALIAALRRGRSRGPRWTVAAAGIVVVGAAAFALGAKSHATASCDGGEARLAGVWDGARKEALHAAFAATGAPYAETAWTAAGGRLDRYARAWSATHREACRATRVDGRQSDRLLDLRMECLERRRTTLASLTDLWARGMDTDMVAAAIDAAERLPALAPCSDTRALLSQATVPSDPAQAAQVAAARRGIAAAEAEVLAGRYRAARATAAAARVAAEATGWQPLVAEAAYTEGHALASLQMPAAAASLLEAARLAGAAHDDRLVATTLLELSDYLGESRRGADALITSEIAQGVVTRAGDDVELALRALLNHGVALYSADRIAAARATLATARARAEAMYGADSVLTIEADADLVRVLESQGDIAGARDLAVINLARAITRYGGEHPRVASMMINLGITVDQLGDPAGAEALYRRVLAIKRRATGDDGIAVALTLNQLGIVLRKLARLEEAEEALREALAIEERVHGPSHSYTATVLGNLAAVLLKQQRYDEALALQERALAIKTSIDGPDHPRVANSVIGIGNIYLERGDPAGALPRYRRALEIREKNEGPDHLHTHETRAGVATALVALHRCGEARPLLTSALEGITRTGGAGNRKVFPVLVGLARCELEAHHGDRAREWLRRAEALYPVVTPAERELAQALMAQATRR